MDIFDWIKANLKPEVCTSDRFIYDDMDSQSGRSLPIIYQPFDLRDKSHWQDRGALFDFLYSTRGKGKRLLDFGPGDGWPSLIVAPFVSEVVGVDGSHRRVDVCTENAARMGLANARFYYAAPGSPLPFEDDSFDGVMAASSVEQSPDPRRTLQELFRVLRPGGHLRITYEALNWYRNGQERDIWLQQTNDHQCRLILFDRTIDREVAVQYGITYDLSEAEFKKIVWEDTATDTPSVSFSKLTIPLLERTRRSILDARVCTTVHPSGRTLASWLSEIGFKKIIPSHSGGWFAAQLFETLADRHRPQSLSDLDALLRPVVRVVTEMYAPIDMDPMITAIK